MLEALTPEPPGSSVTMAEIVGIEVVTVLPSGGVKLVMVGGVVSGTETVNDQLAVAGLPALSLTLSETECKPLANGSGI